MELASAMRVAGRLIGCLSGVKYDGEQQEQQQRLAIFM